MGVTALVPMVAFFGSGVLNKSDFESFPWSVVMLAMGGIVLGDAATCSGLLTEMASVLALMVSGFSTWEVWLLLAPLLLAGASEEHLTCERVGNRRGVNHAAV